MTATTTIVGYLTRDPELRYTQAGRAALSLGVAAHHRWQQQGGEWQEQTSFFNVTCWGDLAENAATSLNKGDRIVATGRLEQRKWTTDAGEERTVVELVASDLGPSLRWATASPEQVLASNKPPERRRSDPRPDEEPF